MALDITRTGDVIHVVETTFSGTQTVVKHWYYDMKNHLVSSHGCENDTPDRAMTASAIAWAEKHYVPKAKLLEVSS